MQNSNLKTELHQKVTEEDNNRFFRTIGEVSAELKISPHVLRFWESKFSTIKPHKRRGGHRYYSDADIIAIKEIQDLLHEKGLTIKGAKKFLREKTSTTHLSQNSQAELEVQRQSSLFEEDKKQNIEVSDNNSDSKSETAEIVRLTPRDTEITNKADKRMVSMLIKELESIKATLLEN